MGSALALNQRCCEGLRSIRASGQFILPVTSHNERDSMASPPSAGEILLRGFHLLLPQVDFLKENEMVSFGPDPVLRAVAEEGDVAENEV